jgi:uroporphyrinogen-III synthase
VTRVAITTDRFAVAATPFRMVGLDPVPMPCIRIEAADPILLDRARAAATGADLLLISSARTVDLLWPDSMPAVEVAAVGSQTSATISARGGRVVLCGRAGLADLAVRLRDRWHDSKVVFPHGSVATGSRAELPGHLALAGMIEASGGHLHEFVIYRTMSQAPGPDQVEAAAFASPSAVAGWRLSRSLVGLVIGAIGRTTREALAVHGKVDVLAPRPTHQALAKAMASYLEVTA